MLFSVDQAFVARYEKRAPPKTACVEGYEERGETVVFAG